MNRDLLFWEWDDGGCWNVCRLRVLREFAVRVLHPRFGRRDSDVGAKMGTFDVCGRTGFTRVV